MRTSGMDDKAAFDPRISENHLFVSARKPPTDGTRHTSPTGISLSQAVYDSDSRPLQDAVRPSPFTAIEMEPLPDILAAL